MNEVRIGPYLVAFVGDNLVWKNSFLALIKGQKRSKVLVLQSFCGQSHVPVLLWFSALRTVIVGVTSS